MAENDQAQEKTEEPTQRRLDKAREDGDVLSSKEMFVFASSIAGLFVLLVLGLFSGQVVNGWASLFEFSHPEELLTLKTLHAWQSYKLLLLAAAMFGIPCFFFIIGMQAFVGGGLSISGKALGFKFEKLNLIKGLGRIFSIKGLVELIKSIAKVVFLTTCVVVFLWYMLPSIIYLSAGSLDQGLGVLYKTLIYFVLSLVFILFAIGVGDYIWSRHTWLQKLRMTRQDMKEEFKESEGSPEVKARMRRLQMEASQRAAEQSQAVESVKDATVIITNPTHFAVAIKYEPETDDAPLILAMGKDLIAKRVIEQAELHSKTIVRSPILARALYFTGDIGQTISEQLYAAVASILAYVFQLERGVDASLQDPEIPSDFIFDEKGRNI
ncbi:EscU/YscU/HrcU family type III secretion system export apparatus switch protein [Rhodobacteraceae bacterium]|nr:EscU/YscU/HrcU family type III secretion system export apparatus switch protein [Paracoccaceae bacterium]